MTQDSQLWKEHLQYTAVSDIGMRRTSNQDSHAVELATDVEGWRRRGHLFLVADGMGAHAAGELASQLAADTIPHLYFKQLDLSAPDSLKQAVIDSNSEINRKGQANQDFHNMGTTCSVLTLLPQGAVIAHVGDSRIYRLRGGLLEQLTVDHSLVWELRAAGQSTPNSDIESMIPRNVITRSLGPYAEVNVDLEGPFPIEVNDTFLLCSDGLVGEVSDPEIAAILSSLPVDEAAQALVDLANLRGGPDNITIVVCQVTGSQLTTNAASTTPITVGSRPPSRKSLPVLWAIFIACLLAVGLMSLVGSWQIVIALGVISLLTLLAILIKTYGAEMGGTTISGGRRFGRGPYTQTSPVADHSLMDNLRDMIEELRTDSTLGLGDSVNNDVLAEANQAKNAGNVSVAVRSYMRVLSGLLKLLRDSKRK
jgi:serine/threonine protein phosphatase PrpC